MSTPIYAFPSPTLAQAADGPAAYAALADRMEREQTTLRSTSVNIKETQINVAAGNSYAVHVADFPLSTIGWINAEVCIAFGVQDSNPAAYPAIAGTLILNLGGSVVRTVRWHNQSRSRLLEKTVSGHKLITAAMSTINIQVALQVDVTGAPISYFMSEITVRQFGAPST